MYTGTKFQKQMLEWVLSKFYIDDANEDSSFLRVILNRVTIVFVRTDDYNDKLTVGSLTFLLMNPNFCELYFLYVHG